MSIEEAKLFIEKLKHDEQLAKKISQCRSTQEKINIAKSEGYNISSEDIKIYQSTLENEELDKITAGREQWCIKDDYGNDGCDCVIGAMGATVHFCPINLYFL